MSALYNLKTVPDGYRITKFDSDMNIESSYTISEDGKECDCPAGHRNTCRHRDMFVAFVYPENPDLCYVDSDWFFDYDTGIFVRPLNLRETLEESVAEPEPTPEPSPTIPAAPRPSWRRM